nr:hypothetical protein [Sedimentibacter sp.]
MKKTALLLITASLLLAAGCTSNFEVNEDAVKEVSDKITKTIINSVGEEKVQKTEAMTFDGTGLNKIKIDSSVGDITVKSHESQEIAVNIIITAKSGSKEKAEKLLESYTYTQEKTQYSVDIDTSTDGFDFADGNYIETSMEVYLPSNIENTEIALNVGDIDIDGINGSFDIHSNVGNINIQNGEGFCNLEIDVGDIVLSGFSAAKSSEFSINTGDIELNLTDISNADKIAAETQVGTIDVTMPENSGYQATIEEFMEDKKTLSEGDGKTEISLKTNVGDIEFN